MRNRVTDEFQEFFKRDRMRKMRPPNINEEIIMRILTNLLSERSARNKTKSAYVSKQIKKKDVKFHGIAITVVTYDPEKLVEWIHQRVAT